MKLQIKLLVLLLFFNTSLSFAAQLCTTTPIPDATADEFKGISGISDTNIIAVGKKSDIFKYDGSSWTKMSPPAGVAVDLDDIYMLADGTAYAVGKKADGHGTVIHYDGLDWIDIGSNDIANQDLKGVWAYSASEVYAVGKRGTLVSYDGASWSDISGVAGVGGNDLEKVWGNATSVYVLGKDGTLYIYDRSGGTWSSDGSCDAASGDDFKDLWEDGSGNVYLAGKDGSVYLYDGAICLSLDTASDDLEGIHGSSSGDIYAVGKGGVVMYYNGSTWTETTQGTEDLKDVWVSDTGNVYYSGKNAEVTTCEDLHFSISHDGFAQPGVAESITITMHDQAHATKTSYTGTITISTTTSHGNWSVIAGTPANLTDSGNGDAIYIFAAADSGQITLGLTSTFEETLNIDITDLTVSEDPSEDANLIFSSITTSHFAISHDGSGNACAPEDIIITKHDASHGTDTGYTGTITLSTSTFHGDWSVVSGGTPANLTNSGGGDAVYIFAVADLGEVIFGLANTFSETLTIGVDDGSDSVDPAENSSLTYSNTLSGTVSDNFDPAAVYSGSDGTIAWTSDWAEINEADGATNGDLRVVTDDGDYSLQIKDKGAGGPGAGPGEGVQRIVDLTEYTSATLTFDYRRQALDNANDNVTIAIYNNLTTSWDILDTFSGGGTDATYQTPGLAPYDISSYIASDTTIRFFGSTTLGDRDIIYFDDVVISASGPMVCPVADHYSISHDGTGINCQAESVTIEAHSDSHDIVSDHTGDIDLSTSTGNGDWSKITGAGGALVNSGGGVATYTFDGTEFGSVELGLKNTFVETTNIDILDGSSRSESTGTALASEDSDLAFAEAGFSFTTITTQIGGKSSDIAPDIQTLEIEAIKTSDSTGQCEAALVGANTIDLAFQCLDPSTCTASQVSISGTDIAGNDSGPIGSYTGVSLDFGTDIDTTATFTMSYPDVGQLSLHARYNIPLDSGAPSGNLMLGSSNDFVVRPFGFDISVAANPGTTTAAGGEFTSAGTSFNTTVRAVLWQAVDDTDLDGIPEGHDDADPANNVSLADNTAALNFWQETVAEDVILTSQLFLPTGGTDPGLSGTITITGFAAGAATTAINFTEVGIIEIAADLTDASYLGTGSVTGRSGHVGRFTPHHFMVTANVPTFADSCGGVFTYLEQPFLFGTSPSFTIEARSLAGSTTKNYGGDGSGEDFWNLSAPLLVAGNYADVVGGSSTFTVTAAGTITLTNAADYDGLGTMTVSGASFTYDRPAASPLAPFSGSVDFTLSAADFTDDDTICYDLEPDNTCDFVTISTIGGALLRHGRLALLNSFGPETESLTIPVRLDYFDGTAFIANPDDSCSSFDSVDLNCSDPDIDSLACANVALSGVGIGHNQAFILAAPDNNASGSLNYSLPGPIIGIWLQYDWDDLDNLGDGPYDDNPNATATFGIYRGNDRIINWKEIVR